jgi:hypothetical protein
VAAQRKFGIETDYINAVFGTGIYSLTVSRKGASDMRLIGVTIPDVTFIFMNGRVVRSDMLDMRGLWHVRGKTVDGLELELIVAVISSEYDVELLEVLAVKEKR